MSIGAISPSSVSPPPARDTRPAQPSASAPQRSAATSTTLTPEALALIDQLKARDTEVRQHEQAHLATAGGLAVSGASYTYQRGPNGVSYAIGGEVNIDTSPGGTPEETIQRARHPGGGAGAGRTIRRRSFGRRAGAANGSAGARRTGAAANPGCDRPRSADLWGGAAGTAQGGYLRLSDKIPLCLLPQPKPC